MDHKIEKCILCDGYVVSNISEYVSAGKKHVGRVCTKCWTEALDRTPLTIPRNLVFNTPDDAELGAEIRKLYYENNS